MKIIILGGGLVGSVIARDLQNEFDVTIADVAQERLRFIKEKFSLHGIEADLSNSKTIKKIVSGYDVVIGAVPGFLGFGVLKSVIEARKNIVDISFFSEDAFELDTLAKKNNVTAIVDCGIAPGSSNLIIGYHHAQMDEVENVECYVGGLPVVRELPFEYKIVFSPVDVIEEYTRPARIIENGSIVIKDALSEIELHNFPDVGTLESFNSDGLRSLMKTIHAKNMKEKTLRYPGHAEKMKLFRETGLFSKEEIFVNGKTIRPLDVMAKLLFPQWKLNEGEEDVTVLQVVLEGRKGKKRVRVQYDLLDRYDKEQNITSMARTTGYTCSVAARLVAKKLYSQKGISPPEFIGAKEKCFEFMMNGLRERKIIFQKKVE
ncbi:MAG: saccharopine dehydrogenase NADP-binding domain-containing protein [Ignavibacteriales bacterium]|nr:saccharopine dehydrogenase NADP-binding domain-containing protein [Ignavibacteriales bacterium]